MAKESVPTLTARREKILRDFMMCIGESLDRLFRDDGRFSDMVVRLRRTNGTHVFIECGRNDSFHYDAKGERVLDTDVFDPPQQHG